MRLRVVVVSVALWVAVVTAGSGMTWLAIDRAGRDVVDGRDSVAKAPVAVAPHSAMSTRQAATRATPHQHPRRRHPATRAPRSAHTTTPDPTSPTTNAAPGQGGPNPSPQPSRFKPSAHSTPASRTVTRTWSGSPGRITVSCSGDRASLVSTSPADGWRVDVGSRGPDQVQVEFKQGEEGSEAQVTASCVAGSPRFSSAVVQRDD